VETLKDLDKLRRSKYVQSDMGKTFILARSFLEDSRLVLFTGTPCQVAGLKSFLSKEYSNLFTADIFCHGVPSPVVWKIFLEQSSHKTHLKKIDFRINSDGIPHFSSFTLRTTSIGFS
jgi:coenzyme F420-reducing hydrogenase beta subunit